MKRKELKNLAQKIAKLEYIIQTTNDVKEKQRAENEIIVLSGKVTRFEDIATIDEMVQDILKNNLDF